MEPVLLARLHRFSGLRALIHVALVFFVVNAVALALMAAAGSVDARKLGELDGEILPEAALFTLIASFGRQTLRPVVFRVGAILATASALGWVPFFLIAVHTARESRRLTVPETAAFERRAGKLCQPAIGIALADPGDAFEPDPDRARRSNQALAKQEGLHSWVWTSRRPGQAGRLFIQVMKGFGADWREFSQFMSGLRQEIRTPDATVDVETADSRSKPYRYRLALRRQGVAFDLSCVSAQVSQTVPLIVCAETVAIDHAALRASRESLAISDCR